LLPLSFAMSFLFGPALESLDACGRAAPETYGPAAQPSQ
jgi:hypothetical protein